MILFECLAACAVCIDQDIYVTLDSSAADAVLKQLCVLQPS